MSMKNINKSLEAFIGRYAILLEIGIVLLLLTNFFLLVWQPKDKQRDDMLLAMACQNIFNQCKFDAGDQSVTIMDCKNVDGLVGRDKEVFKKITVSCVEYYSKQLQGE